MKILFLLTCLSLTLTNSKLMAQSRTAPDMEQLYTEANSSYRKFESIHGGYVQTDNVLMHYLCWGNPKNTPLIWSHGSFSHSYELADLARLLTDGGYYLIAVDYYGHGQTPVPEKEVSLYNSADDIRVLMDSLKIDQAIIGGFSRGGYIAAAFYQSYPERVKALILEDGGSVAFNTFNHRMSEEALEIKIKSMAPEQGVSSIYEASFDSPAAAYQSLYDKSAGGLQFELLNIVKRKGNQWITYAGLNDFFCMKDDQQFKSLVLKPNNSPLYGASITMVQPKIIFRNLHIPLLILDPVADHDPMPFEKDNIALANQFPGLITRVEFAGIEHNIHYEKPAQFSQELLKFLGIVQKQGLSFSKKK
ncbi:pimeloyl-ACP methyl ester carboxylesterase [Pedobacter cryoconitis]|uniref:Pimeloyl-ACP methyl ester carboxylesterase n=1 Tax=Pedobacter cryoconitis TaxID=188932 RepID=A0A7W8YVQ2_9SPHI|nr:alpha/beta hydrolase [Pedobacter cryoconitis]MBB5622619.1 pimeloyl-ACP methyl ester carboxylesterase [Pedobacter cryoconitis]